MAPDKIFMRVDLPAPFNPKIAILSPWLILKLQLFNIYFFSFSGLIYCFILLIKVF
jgi:hypothetical protein